MNDESQIEKERQALDDITRRVFSERAGHTVIDVDRMKSEIDSKGYDAYSSGVIVIPESDLRGSGRSYAELSGKLDSYRSLALELQDQLHGHFPEVDQSVKERVKNVVQRLKRRVLRQKQPSLEQIFQKQLQLGQYMMQSVEDVTAFSQSRLDALKARMMSRNISRYDHAILLDELRESRGEAKDLYDRVNLQLKEAANPAELTNFKNLLLDAASAISAIDGKINKSSDNLKYWEKEDPFLLELYRMHEDAQARLERTGNQARLFRETYELVYETQQAIGLSVKTGILIVKPIEAAARYILNISDELQPQYTEFTGMDYDASKKLDDRSVVRAQIQQDGSKIYDLVIKDNQSARYDKA